jgi:hypothetical protein
LVPLPRHVGQSTHLRSDRHIQWWLLDHPPLDLCRATRHVRSLPAEEDRHSTLVLIVQAVGAIQFETNGTNSFARVLPLGLGIPVHVANREPDRGSSSSAIVGEPEYGGNARHDDEVDRFCRGNNDHVPRTSRLRKPARPQLDVARHPCRIGSTTASVQRTVRCLGVHSKMACCS